MRRCKVVPCVPVHHVGVRQLGSSDSEVVAAVFEHLDGFVEHVHRLVRRHHAGPEQRSGQLDPCAQIETTVSGHQLHAAATSSRTSMARRDSPSPFRAWPSWHSSSRRVDVILPEQRRSSLEQVRRSGVVECAKRSLAGSPEPGCGFTGHGVALRPRRRVECSPLQVRCRRGHRPRHAPSSQPASRSCISARTGRPIAPYAASWTSGWTNPCCSARCRTSRRRLSDARRCRRVRAISSFGSERTDRFARERAPHHCGPREELALARLEHVDAAREERVEGRGNTAVRELGLHRVGRELLEIERHSLGGVEYRLGDPLVECLTLRAAPRRGERASSPARGSSRVARCPQAER